MPSFRFKDHKTQQLSQSVGEVLSRNYSESEFFEFAPYDPTAGERGGYSNYSYWGSTLRSFAQNKVAMFFLILMVGILAFTVVEPMLPYAPEANTIYKGATNLAPCKEYWFGTEIYNLFDNVPQTLVVIIISYILRPGVSTMIFAMCLTSWLQTARLVRNQVLIIRDRDYNLASRCLGTATWRIMVKNLLPYLVSILTLRMALAIPAAIGNEVFITYIGLGVPLEIPTLGNLIKAGQTVMMESTLSYQLFFPVIILSIITISFYIVGNSFADAADPKNHVK